MVARLGRMLGADRYLMIPLGNSLSNTRHAPVGLSAYGLAIIEERCITAAKELEEAR